MRAYYPHARRSPFLAIVLALILPLVAEGAEDTLVASAFINHTQFLISSGGTFKLGFFSPPKSNYLYLGIWYSWITPSDVVWVANRRRPLQRTSAGFLTLAPNGSLMVTDGEGREYWSTKVTPAGDRAPVARLLDNGNLIVDVGGAYPTWQSFDHPADTMLPGMKLGYDRQREVGTNFTSWKGTDDPSPGSFTLVMDTRGDPQPTILRGGAPWWRAGPWVGRQYSGIPDMKPYNNFSYSFVSSDEGIFFRYDVWDNSMLTKVVLNSSGYMEHKVWYNSTTAWETIWSTGDHHCDSYNLCGPNAVCSADASCSCLPGFRPRKTGSMDGAGCEPEKSISACREGEGEFKLVPSVKLPDTSGAAADEKKGTPDTCRAACLQSCSCTAFAISDGSGCITWSGELLDLQVYHAGQGQELYLRVAGSAKKKNKTALILISLSVGLVVVLVLICLYVQRQRLRRRLTITKYYTKDVANMEAGHDDACKDLELKTYPFGVIASATDDFSFASKLGEGGFGPVYKGILNGEVVAVKRLSKGSRQGIDEYKSEIQLMGKLQHTNLVKLLGFCIESEEKILVYEYMPNQSLDKYIFDPKKASQLDWEKRLHIIEGVTQGLLYLHKYSRLTVIHRDLKASNVLLDSEWNPKISDFGLARAFTWEDSPSNTGRIVGTYGYMPPEYAIKGLFSVKSDVFSYGVMVLEILSGKKNASIEHFGVSSNLLGFAWRLWIEGRELELLDPVLGSDTALAPQLSRRVHIALLCVQVNPMDRPTMFDVVYMINNETAVLPSPKQPAFYVGSGHPSETEGPSCSNDMTLTQVQCR